MAADRGGVISPLLANISLPGLDRYGVPRDAALGELCRSADDLVISCRSPLPAPHARHAVRLVLQTRKLPLHPTKTRVVAMAQEGLDFLGHGHQRRAKRTGKRLPSRWPSQKAMPAIRRARHGLTSRPRLAEGRAAVSRQRKPVLTGWRHYVQLGKSTMKRQQVDRDVWQRVRRLVRATRGSRGPWKASVCAGWWQGSGVATFDQPGISGT